MGNLMKFKIESANENTNWVVGTYKGLEVQAKVFDEPSEFGIREGRVSKLEVSRSKDEIRSRASSRMGKDVLYSYDRGEDVNKLSSSIFDGLLAELESLPFRSSWGAMLENYALRNELQESLSGGSAGSRIKI